jgi:hypothetical protein
LDVQAVTDLAADARGRIERTHQILGNQRDRLTTPHLDLVFGQGRQVNAAEMNRPGGDLCATQQEPHDRQAGRRLAAP